MEYGYEWQGCGGVGAWLGEQVRRSGDDTAEETSKYDDVGSCRLRHPRVAHEYLGIPGNGAIGVYGYHIDGTMGTLVLVWRTTLRLRQGIAILTSC